MRKNRIVSILMSMLMIIAGSYTSIFADSVSLTKLDKPTVTRLQCSTVYWNPVENADTYDVYIEVWRGDKGVGGEAAVDLTDTSFYIYDYCVELMSDA